MFQEMPDWWAQGTEAGLATGPIDTVAAVALDRFEGLSADIHGAAILGPGNGVLATSGRADPWRVAAAALLEAADAAAGEPATQAHVATEEGEVFAVRHAGLAMVAVTRRFVLASLVMSDMRATLRAVSQAAVPVVQEAA